MRAWAIGLDMFYATAGMLLVGAAVDHFAGTRPWWMLGLGLLGLVAGMVRFILDAARLNRDATPRSRPGRPGPDPSGQTGRSPAEQENPPADRSPPG